MARWRASQPSSITGSCAALSSVRTADWSWAAIISSRRWVSAATPATLLSARASSASAAVSAPVNACAAWSVRFSPSRAIPSSSWIAGSSIGYDRSLCVAAEARAAAGSPSCSCARGSPDRASTAGSMSPVVSAMTAGPWFKFRQAHPRLLLAGGRRQRRPTPPGSRPKANPGVIFPVCVMVFPVLRYGGRPYELMITQEGQNDYGG
jgi:hypothetical protein